MVYLERQAPSLKLDPAIDAPDGLRHAPLPLDFNLPIPAQINHRPESEVAALWFLRKAVFHFPGSDQ